jgi:hypothetical protein
MDGNRKRRAVDLKRAQLDVLAELGLTAILRRSGASQGSDGKDR